MTPIDHSSVMSELLPSATQRIAQALNPEKIILFGSYAYGKPTADSDVDLLVIMNTSKRGADRVWDVSQLLVPRAFAVDILVKTPEEVALARKRKDFFVEEIMTRGKVLYERSS